MNYLYCPRAISKFGIQLRIFWAGDMSAIVIGQHLILAKRGWLYCTELCKTLELINLYR